MRQLAPLVIFLFLSVGVYGQSDDVLVAVDNSNVRQKKKKKRYRLPEIDLSHWKVTLPISDNNRPIEVEPPEILEYATNSILVPFMYNDSTDGSLVFHAYPESTTANTKYSRTELREQMEPGSNSVNWKFSEGGLMKGTMRMEAVSKDRGGKYHKVIIMQIHGRLSNDQRDQIGQKDNNAPPILKIYWQDGKIRVKTKELTNSAVSPEGVLFEEAWKDDRGRTFEEEIGFNKFNIEVKVSKGKLVVSLNKGEFFVYDNASIRRWDVFENYFKAGNYLQTRDEGAFAKVKFYKLEISH